MRVAGPQGTIVRALIGDPRATPALLEFLADTRVGRMPSQVQVQPRGGGERDEEGLGVAELETLEEGLGDEESEEEDGPGPPI